MFSTGLYDWKAYSGEPLSGKRNRSLNRKRRGDKRKVEIYFVALSLHSDGALALVYRHM